MLVGSGIELSLHFFFFAARYRAHRSRVALPIAARVFALIRRRVGDDPLLLACDAGLPPLSALMAVFTPCNLA